MPYLYGEHNNHLRHIEKILDIDIASRSNNLELKGAPKNLAVADKLFKMLWEKLTRKQDVTTSEIDAALRFLKGDETVTKTADNSTALYDEQAGIKTYKNKLISPRSPNQAYYINAIRDHDMVFGVGPAGTGKTFLAVAAAVEMFQAGDIERMVFCRPAVEAGENLGFLPGSMIEKIDPYLRPIYDALNEMMPSNQLQKKLESGDIEIAPLAFMRGRTLKNAFVILDESQNTTSMQMKMFLTRMGEGTRMVITGDPTQVDLPSNAQSGLKEAMNILGNIDDIPFVHFDSKDVVRHNWLRKLLTLMINMNSGVHARKMETPIFNNLKEGITVDISVQYPEWERIEEIEDIVRIATLCAINAIALPTIATDRDLEVSVVLANDDLLHILNREYREKDTPTNVLTFANLDGEDINTEGVLNLGDVLLSFETIQRESKEQGKFMLDHLRHLIVHGVLHLLGFDHKTEEEANDMEALEIRILQQLGVQNPYTGTILA